ncbi:MAG: RIP metalloprotease RseP, partial [Comamonas sp.]
MLTVVAFVVALAILIAVHEYGHYRVAVACGVKVLRFSVGFGKPLLRWRKKNSPTEFVIGAIPLGGYVRMLDEREAPVAPEERHLAFNTQPLRSRAAIVAAGPIANLLLAVLLYACVNWIGVREPAAFMGTPPAQSLMAKAGVQGGEQVVGMGLEGDDLQAVRSLEDLRWFVAQAALNGKDVQLRVKQSEGASEQSVRLPLSTLAASDADAQLMEKIGLTHPWSDPVLGDFEAGSAAEKSQLRKGDKVLQIDGAAVPDGAQLRSVIRAAGADAAPAVQDWLVERNGQAMHVLVQLTQSEDRGKKIGRLGAYIGSPITMVQVRYGLWEGFAKGVQKTWEVSTLTVKMMAKMVIGQASLQNISGP